MKVPKRLQPLIEEGVIDAVHRQLQSGKEAAVYVVECGGVMRCAKVYKDLEQRNFRKAVEYREGRKTRGSRDARATGRRSGYGRKVQESAWKSAEVDALYRLSAAGVHVPTPQGVYDGVLIMDLVLGEDGLPAPRLGEIDMTADEARAWHACMIEQIVRMLCVGLIHGDLSEYNVLLAESGPVIIDLPQAVEASGNNNAFRMLARDVNNMRSTFGRADPELLNTDYAHEIWALYEHGKLTPETPLSGRFEHDQSAADVDAVLDQIDEARWEAEARELGRIEAKRGHEPD